MALLTFVVLPRDSRQAETPWSFQVFKMAYAPVLRHAPTVRLLTATAIRSICWLGFLTYLGAFLSQEHDLSTKGIGLVYTIGATGFAVGSSIAGRLIGPAGARTVVGVMCVVTALATVAAGFATNTWFAVGSIVVLAMASAMIAIGVTLLLSTESPGEQGTTMLLNSSVVNFGAAVGAAIGGGLIALGGYRAFGGWTVVVCPPGGRSGAVAATSEGRPARTADNKRRSPGNAGRSTCGTRNRGVDLTPLFPCKVLVNSLLQVVARDITGAVRRRHPVPAIGVGERRTRDNGDPGAGWQRCDRAVPGSGA